MTIPLPMAVSLPVSSLLAPQPGRVPSTPLPSPSAAVLGPLPPTTPIHLALNWIALSDIPEYQPYRTTPPAGDDGECAATVYDPPRPAPGRALIVTGNKAAYHQALQEEDEDWIREQGSGYEVVSRLKRIDFRYCPSPRHLMLLLSLLTSSPDREKGDEGYNLPRPPGLIILWDIAGMMMDWQGGNENANPPAREFGGNEMQVDEPAVVETEDMAVRTRFKRDVTISQYLDLMAMARSAAEHFRSTASKSAPQLIILEPQLDEFMSLPILRPGDTMPPPFSSQADVTAPPSPSRGKKIRLYDALRWLLGDGALAMVTRCDEDPTDPFAPSFLLRLASEPSELYSIRRRRCGRSEWAAGYANPDEDEREGDQGGWRWEWC